MSNSICADAKQCNPLLDDKNGNILAEKNGNDIVSVYIKE